MNGGPRVAGTLDAPECRLDRAVVGTFVCPKWAAVWTSSSRGMGFCEKGAPYRLRSQPATGSHEECTSGV